MWKVFGLAVLLIGSCCADEPPNCPEYRVEDWFEFIDLIQNFLL
tara:strand:+ start:433 stop:564 length:132 start_codon:yes stop_codon:yes gene_type:complete